MELPIHGRYPTTAGCEDFCLLRFRPGPIRPSLDNLVNTTSAVLTILTPSLVRTPDRHRATTRSYPILIPFPNSSFPVTWITGVRHYPQLLYIVILYIYDSYKAKNSMVFTRKSVNIGTCVCWCWGAGVVLSTYENSTLKTLCHYIILRNLLLLHHDIDWRDILNE